ncbi:MAG: EAL domain-containing protein, partial [Nitrospirota bacterium]|nr:EAL domain-containing protein [Nitrospirota bacterium]
YITVSANRENIERLKFNAAAMGNTLLATTEQMSIDASRKLALMTHEALERARIVRTILIVTILLTFIFSLLIAFRLTKSITDPINVLVNATRAIAAGDLDYSVSYKDKTEFGELADNFNIMSSALKEGYTELEEDIAKRKEAEAALAKSEERYALAAQGANDGLWDWDITNNRIYYSPRWKMMLGGSESDINDSPEEWFGRVHPDDRKKLDSQFAAHMLGNTPHFESEYRITHKDGTYRWALSRGIAVRDTSGKAFRIAGSQSDITARKSAEEQLIYDAFHDALTGLPNRALFMDRLQQALRALETQARRHRDHNFAVLFIDLDRFKVINDSLGHIIGDRLLVAVGQRLLNCLRPSDSVARLGGDEYAVLLETSNERKDFIDIAERIQADLPIPFLIDGRELITTASIGIAFGSGIYSHADEIIRDADIAMYQAKAKGKSRIEIFEEHMHASFIDRLKLEADLRMALDHRELRLHYQPILDMTSNRLTGFEALVRWFHPTRGIIFPLDFIPLAEESGLIMEIGEWIFREACTQLVIWQKKYTSSPGLTMSMNISGRQFSNPALLDQIILIVKDVGIEPGSLIIEITESIIMDNTDLALATLQKLRKMGFQLHIDDFGTGYSSLSYINVFPVTALKIDRS